MTPGGNGVSTRYNPPMGRQDSAHTRKTFRCMGQLTDNDAEPLPEEQPLPDNHPEAPGTAEVPITCGTKLNFTDHGRFVSNAPRDTGFEAAGLRFDCPECGDTHWLCPICSEPLDSDDNSPSGWFRSEDTGEQIPCHNCNQPEIQERRRHHGHAGEFGERRRR